LEAVLVKGVKFGEKHSYNDFSLLLAKVELGAPQAKVNKIDVEGADSSLDLTEYFGSTKYENVVHKFDFVTIAPPSTFTTLFSTIKNYLHGKKMRIVLDDDPSFYYIGRLSVSSFTSDRGIGHVAIEADCEPYKYKSAKTTVSKAISGTETVILTNARKHAVPKVTIQTDSSINIVFGVSNVWDLGSGSFTLPELELSEGANTVTVTGTGTITFEWQEGEL
jgi:phage-related protein